MLEDILPMLDSIMVSVTNVLGLQGPVRQDLFAAGCGCFIKFRPTFILFLFFSFCCFQI